MFLFFAILTFCYGSGTVLLAKFFRIESDFEKKLLTRGLEKGLITLEESKSLYIKKRFAGRGKCIDDAFFTFAKWCLSPFFLILFPIFYFKYNLEIVLIMWFDRFGSLEEDDVKKYTRLFEDYCEEFVPPKKLKPEYEYDLSFLEEAKEHKQLLAKVDDLVK